MHHSSKKLFDFIQTTFADSPKGVFSKKEILDLLDGAYSKWLIESASTFHHSRGEREEVKDGQAL